MALGSARGQIFMDPTDASNLNDETPRFGLGDEVFHAGGMFIYVQHHQGAGVVASAVGQAAFWRDFSAGVATPDKTDNEDGAAIMNGVAGIYQGVVTHLRYTWLRKRGEMAGVLLDGNGAVGDKIFTPAGDQNTLSAVVTGSATAAQAAAQLVGWQKVLGVGNVATVMLQIL